MNNFDEIIGPTLTFKVKGVMFCEFFVATTQNLVWFYIIVKAVLATIVAIGLKKSLPGNM